MITLWAIEIKYDTKLTKETGKLFLCFAGIYAIVARHQCVA